MNKFMKESMEKKFNVEELFKVDPEKAEKIYAEVNNKYKDQADPKSLSLLAEELGLEGAGEIALTVFYWAGLVYDVQQRRSFDEQLMERIKAGSVQFIPMDVPDELPKLDLQRPDYFG